MTARLRSILFPFVVFATNLAVSWRYFRAGYTNQLQSVEGGFIALETYIQRHWPLYDWFPMWYGGMPFTRTYQPGFHYAVAALSAIAHIKVVSAFHALGACTYALGGVAFYFLAKSLLLSADVPRPRYPAFFGALLFSLFSPSTLVSPLIRQDAGGFFSPRRLHVLALYGEGPNITGLALGMFALAAIHVALRKKTPGSAVIAAVSVALVPLVNWPATLALMMGIVCYLAALEWDTARLRDLGRVVAIGLIAAGLALPLALPSTITHTFTRANAMSEGPTPGAGRWIAIALLLVCLATVRFVLVRARAPFHLRFAALWALLTVWIVVTVSHFEIRIIAQAMRFHASMEIPLMLVAVFIGAMLPGRKVIAALVLIFCAFQAHTYRRWVHDRLAPIDITKTGEYQLAKWADGNLNGQRIFVAGTFRFWLNAFTETPQVTGLFDQSITNPIDPHVAYLLSNGYRSDQESSDYSLIWLKAFGADAINAEGPKTADVYRDFQFPDRFKGVLPVLRSDAGDTVYGVPERTHGLARVVRIRDLARHVPENGIDTTEVKTFVNDLDDASLPQARFHWQGADRAQVTGAFTPDEAISVAVNYDPGWKASVDGRPATVHEDGLGFIAIEPGCNGPCTVELEWSQRWEPAFAITMFLLAVGASIAWCLL